MDVGEAAWAESFATAGALSPASEADVARASLAAAAGVPDSEADEAGAGPEVEDVDAAWATRHVFAWRLRLEATPKRRPQPEQTKAGEKGAGSGVSSEAERSVGGRGG